MQATLSVLVILVGLALMIFKIYADSEPGALPLLLLVLGITWFLIVRARNRSGRRG